MLADEIRKKFQDIIRGERPKGQIDPCTAISRLLRESFGTSPTVKSEFESRAIIKEKQVGFLRSHAQDAGIWMNSLPSGSEYLAEGGEAEVYLSKDGQHVIKINDAGYYATWTEYFNSLLLHNILFPNTAYSLLGFAGNEADIFAVVQQPFVEGEQAALNSIEEFLNFNGFEKKKRQDYYNAEFGLVLEDMHDENVISRQDILFFIDTVFYVMRSE